MQGEQDPMGLWVSRRHDLAEVRACAERAVHAAGALLRARAGADEVSHKADGSEVTAVDLASHALLERELTAAFPEALVLSEEGGGEYGPQDERSVWVIDPLDATFPYTAAISVSTVAVALVEAGEPVVAAVCDPFAGLVWSAHRGGGTTVNGAPCRVSGQVGLVGARINLECDDDLPAVLGALHAESRVVALWASVRSACAVADGRFEAVLYGPGSPWDVAAPTLLIQEAGGVAGVLAESGEDGATGPFAASVRYDAPVGCWVGATPGVATELAAVWAAVR